MAPTSPAVDTDDSRLPQPPQMSKPQRPLACVLCQQRKVKCDRRSPCTICVKHKVQCVPVTQPRQRRRRFPERALLDRLRQYEDLLRRNNVRFEPLHGEAHAETKETAEPCDVSHGKPPSSGVVTGPADATGSSSSLPLKSESVQGTKNIWEVLCQEAAGPEDSSTPRLCDLIENTVRRELDRNPDNDEILFPSQMSNTELSTLHPEPVDILRLWQVYLDNVNPLLKVTHVPSLQGRIIEAAGNLHDIPPALEALMFGIYCMAIVSLDANACQTWFASSKESLKSRYQIGCQQALFKAGFLRSVDRECLTGLFLYLLSLGHRSNSRSLCAMLAIAVRSAQLMGIHKESALARCTVFEAEMRRRLWWALMLYDTRISEKSGHHDTTLTPTWDCKIPLNVSDSDMRPEMKEFPSGTAKTSEATFIVVRSELADGIRYNSAHLDFTDPSLRPLAKEWPEKGNLSALEKRVEQDYLRFCDAENPIHLIAIWMARGYTAKYRLMEYFSKTTDPSFSDTEEQRDVAMTSAFTMLECDTILRSSPLTKGFGWFLDLSFPFPAYIHIIQEVRRRPMGERASQAWELMSNNADVRVLPDVKAESSVFRMFYQTILLAWEATEAEAKPGEPLAPPRIITSLRQKEAELAQSTETLGAGGAENRDLSGLLGSMPETFGGNGFMFNPSGLADGFAAPYPNRYPDTTEPGPWIFGAGNFNWP